MKTDLVEIFQSIRAVMQPYASVGFETSINSENTYELYTSQEILIANKKQKLYFSGVKIEKMYVAFYFMPLQTEPNLKKILHPNLMNLLNENYCFHLQELDDKLLNHISQALDAGFTHYKQNQWM